MPYCSARKPWISRTVMPRAYMATILSSKPVKRRSCLGMSSGSKLPSRSRGTSMRSGPSSVRTVLADAAVAVVGRLGGLARAARIAQVVRQLAAQRALDERLLQRHHRGIDLLRRHRAVGHESGPALPSGSSATPPTQRQSCVPQLRSARFLARHTCSCGSWYASHTKFRTGSARQLSAVIATAASEVGIRRM